MSADEFIRLFKYLDSEFKAIRREISETKALVSSCVDTVDTFAKQTEIYHHEMLVLNHQVNRHQGWILKTAEATGVKLSV